MIIVIPAVVITILTSMMIIIIDIPLLLLLFLCPVQRTWRLHQGAKKAIVWQFLQIGGPCVGWFRCRLRMVGGAVYGSCLDAWGP